MELRRNPVPSLITAENLATSKSNELKELIGFDYRELDTNSNSLKLLAQSIKKSYRSYHQHQTFLVHLHLRNGSLDLASDLKDERRMLKEEVDEAIVLINALITDDDLVSEISSSISSLNLQTTETSILVEKNNTDDASARTPMNARDKVVRFLECEELVDQSQRKESSVQGSQHTYDDPHSLEGRERDQRYYHAVGNTKSHETLSPQATSHPEYMPCHYALSASVENSDEHKAKQQEQATPRRSEPGPVFSRKLFHYECQTDTPGPVTSVHHSLGGQFELKRPHSPVISNLIVDNRLPAPKPSASFQLGNYEQPVNRAPESTVGREKPLLSHQIFPSNPDIRSEYVSRPQRPPPLASTAHIPQMDPASLHLLRQNLLRKSDNPYNGEPHLFQTFVNQFNSAIKGIPLDNWDLICILEARTTGKPLKMIQSYMNNFSADPQKALRGIQEDLFDKFGSGSQLATTLVSKLEALPPIRSIYQIDKLEEIMELCKTIHSNINIIEELSQFNNSYGIRKVWNKLPDAFQNTWLVVNNKHKAANLGRNPDFEVFLNFLKTKIKEFSDPSYEKVVHNPFPTKKVNKEIRTYKTGTEKQKTSDGTNTSKYDKCEDTLQRCLIHPEGQHQLKDCRKFSESSRDFKYELMKKNKLCFRCLGQHRKNDCQEEVKCRECGRDHLSIFHKDTADERPPKGYSEDNQASNLCTRICGGADQSISCSKTLLVDISLPGKGRLTLRCYAIIDEQSSSSFLDPKLADFFQITSPKIDYTLTTLSGLKTRVSGIQVPGLKIRGVGEERSYFLPNLLTNTSIPENRNEVASPHMVAAHPHIAHYAHQFNQIDSVAETLILLGRDCTDAMFTRCYGHKAPYVHRTRLGWCLVGEVCSKQNRKEHKAMKTVVTLEHLSAEMDFSSGTTEKYKLTSDPFEELPNDEEPSLSKNDQRFMDIVSQGIYVNDEGKITLPLPFREDVQNFPDNKQSIFKRSTNTLNRIKQDKDKLGKCVAAMQSNIDSRFVEVVPKTDLNAPLTQLWFIPVFPVTHAKKDKIRLVFDSSAKFQGVSLNEMLLSGPDFNNKLRTVLLRFRKKEVAFAADIQSMFYCFHLEPKDRDKTRFFWFANNDPHLPLIQYRARVHLFGNTSSPALAIMGLRYAVNNGSTTTSEEVKEFVSNHFYVDDGLMSCNSPQMATKILTDARGNFMKYGIRLHKIASNSMDVLDSFESTELSHDPQNIVAKSSTQPTLGLQWNTEADTLTLQVDVPERPFTKRGILSTINSLFDPLGIVSPIVLTGRLIQRTLIPSKCKPNPTVDDLGWDDPLPKQYEAIWEEWKRSLPLVAGISIPRCYVPRDFGIPTKRELYIFSDASKDAIGYVAYQRSANETNTHLALVTASSKVSPRSATSIPRLELCAALEAAISANELSRILDIEKTNVTLFTDSMVVLGYINNRVKRFSGYVTRRVELIIKDFPAEHWHYVATTDNPADLASRGQNANSLLSSCWFCGPQFLQEWTESSTSHQDPRRDEPLPETIKDKVTLMSTAIDERHLNGLAVITERVGSYRRAIRVCQFAINFIHKLRDTCLQRRGIALAPRMIGQGEAEIVLIKDTQQRNYPEIIECLKRNKQLPQNNSLAQMSPFLDEDGALRVGGRLGRSKIDFVVKYPLIIPSVSKLTTLIIRHHHETVYHQGRVITHSAVRDAGIFIQNGSKAIKTYMKNCVICAKLRGKFLEQKMSDLPLDRIERSPPFSSSGIDVFGPYYITDGATTRKSNSTKKCWVLLVTCLASRAVHLEPLPFLNITAFKNAFRRFTCIRGKCTLLRSDRGTNFVGAFNQDSKIDIVQLQNELQEDKIAWIFNPPKASHFAGAFERKIGSVRRVIDACMLLMGKRMMTRDEFNTFLAEAASIVNNTPLTAVSSDPNDPFPITPSMLLLQREKGNFAPLESFSEGDLLSYGPRRWRRIQYIADAFWQRWHSEYLQNLTARNKWTLHRRSLSVGDIVIVKDQLNKRNLWPTGRVTAVKLSDDGLVRSASIAVGHKVYDRPISQLVMLIRVSED